MPAAHGHKTVAKTIVEAASQRSPQLLKSRNHPIPFTGIRISLYGAVLKKLHSVVQFRIEVDSHLPPSGSSDEQRKASHSKEALGVTVAVRRANPVCSWSQLLVESIPSSTAQTTSPDGRVLGRIFNTSIKVSKYVAPNRLARARRCL